MTRREIEKLSRKQHILLTAEKLFAHKGLGNTSMADIAQAAEFGVGTLYRYFKDKNELIASLMEQRIQEHFDMLESSMKTKVTPPEQIALLIEAFLTSVNAQRAFFKIYFTCFHPAFDENASSPGLKLQQKRKLELFARINDIYRTGIDNGYFLNVGNEEYLTAGTWGVLMSFYFLALQKDDGAIDVHQMKAIVQQLIFEKVALSA